MTKHKNDIDILEQLNAVTTVRGAVLTAVELFENTLNQLVQRVFCKDDHAVKYAVEPLLNTAGPLGDLLVRLKLLYALGIITQDIYQDIERLIKLRNQLNSDGREFSFTSSETLEPIRKLHAIEKMGIPQLEATSPNKEDDLVLYNMYVARQEQVIRSAFGLAVASICAELDQDNPLL